MASGLYSLEWSYYLLKGYVRKHELLLTTFPTNCFQLSFWSEVMMLARLEQWDIPERAVYFLSDNTYVELLQGMSENDRFSLNFKITLTAHLFDISQDRAIERNLEECVMSACALTPPTNAKAMSMKLSAVCEYLTTYTNFIKRSTLSKVAQYYLSKIDTNKELKNVDNGILGTFVIQQLGHNFSNYNQMRNFIVLYKKTQCLASLKQYIIKNKRSPEVLDLSIFLAQKFQSMGDILAIFQSDPQPFYEIFYLVRSNYQQDKYLSFYDFMFKYSSIRTHFLHQKLYFSTKKQKQNTIKQMITNKNSKIFQVLRNQSLKAAHQCIEVYLKISQFKIPPNKSGKSPLLNPISVIPILRKFWQDPFHSMVLNYCIWLLVDGWLFSTQRAIQIEGQFKNYRKYIFLVLIHITLGYRLGSFANYYPIQNNHLQQLFQLETLPILIDNCAEYQKIPWMTILVNNAFGELDNLPQLEKGFQFINKLLMIKGNNLDQTNGSCWLSGIQNYFVKFHQSLQWVKNKPTILQILNRLENSKNHTEMVQRLRKAILKQSF